MGRIMERNVSLEEISDGKLYGVNDMVKADCNECKGCCDCCVGMGESIVLDPLDVFRLEQNLELSFEQLLADKLEMHVEQGVILPNLKMVGKEERCSFLDEQGRCSIHSFRPGICRLFPLGRHYEDYSFRYFLQTHECTNPNRTKIKIKKWLDTPQIKEYETFILKWHYFIKDMKEKMTPELPEQEMKERNLAMLQLFYIQPYDKEKDFYLQFYERLEKGHNL